jgi:Ni/Fe-hydrogenase subunit HybB-like protein
MKNLVKKLSLWRVLTVVIFAAGLYGLYLRFFKGWQVATNLSDGQPWGFWVGGATLCGVGLAAGGFAVAAAVYLMGLERYRPVVRASVLISFLGYLTVCFGYLYELGLPWRAWHVLFYWNHHSVLFDVALCIGTYTTVLLIEFAPQALEKLPWKFAHKLCEWQHRFIIAIVLAGTLLSSMHQSFLGGLFLIMKGHIYPLWYSPYLHTLFYMSAIPSGLCMLIIATYLSVRSLGAKVEYSVLTELAKVIVPMLCIYGVFRFVDIITHDNARYLFMARSETAYFWFEILLLVVLPVFLFTRPRVLANPVYLYWSAAVEVIGFITNRLNVSITAMEASTHANYVPKWPEVMITVMVIAVAVIAFRLCVLYLDVFPRTAKRERWLSAPATA